MDGWITIGTKLDTNEFDKEYSELERKIQRENNKGEVLGMKLSIQEKGLEDARKKVDNLTEAYKRMKSAEDAIEGKRATPTQFTEYFGMKDTYGSLESLQSQLDRAINREKELEQRVVQTRNQYSGVVEKVEQYRRKLDNINLTRQQEDVRKMQSNFNGVGSSIQNAIQKVGRLALGVFGVRTAFTAVSRASSELANYNPQYAANIEYIRYALTQMIAPVLEYILNLAKTILAYINYIANAWFGVNLFARSSAKSFNQVKRNIGGASSAAKELQKTLAGFDEMNILNSSSTGGGGGVGGGALGPDFDLSDLDAVEIPEWIKWIANNKDIVIGAIIGIASAFLIFKTLQITGVLGAVSKALTGFISSLGFLKGTLATLGIALIIGGIITTIINLINYLNNPTWENFRGVILGLSTVLLGLGGVLLAINSSNPFGWVAIAIGVVGTLIGVLGDLVSKHDDEARKAELVRKQEERLQEARNKLKDATNNYIDAVDRAEDAEKKLKQAQEETGISIDELLDYMNDENLSYKDLNEEQRKVYKAYVNNTTAQQTLKDKTEELSQSQIEQRDELYRTISAYQSTSDSVTDYKNKVVKAYNDGKLSAKDASSAISIALASMDEKTRKSFVEDIPDAIKKGLNPNQYNAIANSFQNWWNGVLNQMQRSSSSITRSIGNSFANLLSQAKNMNITANTGFSVGGYVTKMATGGIINMPNRGVPVANAIAGEAGREGIIPLTDQQAMAQLGAEIGRNVLVNLTNITSMNGRVISRELKNIRSEQDFAYNM